MIINCKIISVNIDTTKTEHYGYIDTEVPSKRLKYKQRRDKINIFLNNYKNNHYKISLFDAVTPEQFVVENNIVTYNHNNFTLSHPSVLYVSNWLSHFNIWNINEDTLVIEDNIIFNPDIFNNLIQVIEEFQTIYDPHKILYLQSTCPSSFTSADKHFNIEGSPTQNICVGNIYNNWAGTAAYFIPKEAKELILKDLLPVCACDGYMHELYRKNIIKYYIPSDINNMFKLDPETSIGL